MMMMKLMMEAVMDVAIWGVTYSLNGSNSLVFIRSFRSFTKKIMNIDRRYTITPTTDAMINRTYNKSIRQTDILKEQKINVSTAAVPALRHWRAMRRHCYSPRVESKAQVVLGFKQTFIWTRVCSILHLHLFYVPTMPSELRKEIHKLKLTL